MPPIQTRKSISLKGTTYTKLKEYAGKERVSMSSVLEGLLAELLPDPPILDLKDLSTKPIDRGERLLGIKKSHLHSGTQTF